MIESCMSNIRSIATAMSLPALLLCISPGRAQTANDPFDGNWIYEQSDGSRHVASICHNHQGSEVDGDWSDGSARGSGIFGHLKEEVKGDKLFVRYCGGDDNSDNPVCPDYQKQESDYFVRQGKALVWYRNDGAKYERYIALYPQVNDGSR